MDELGREQRKFLNKNVALEGVLRIPENAGAGQAGAVAVKVLSPDADHPLELAAELPARYVSKEGGFAIRPGKKYIIRGSMTTLPDRSLKLKIAEVRDRPGKKK